MNIFYGLSEDIGWRESMEDKHSIYHLSEKMFFGAEIYDGHGGQKAACMAADFLTPYFLQLYAEEMEKPLRQRRQVYELIRQAYIEADGHIINSGTKSGTTAAILYILGSRFAAANVGDTRILIGIKNSYSVLTTEHKPGLLRERSRIEKLGGKVIRYGHDRVQGILAVSRALGDAMLKPYISSEPSIIEGSLAKENDYAVLACDGVWDVLSPQDVMKIVRMSKGPEEAAKKVKERAMDYGSTDNITVIVLDLRDYVKDLKNALMNITNVIDYA